MDFIVWFPHAPFGSCNGGCTRWSHFFQHALNTSPKRNKRIRKDKPMRVQGAVADFVWLTCLWNQPPATYVQCRMDPLDTHSNVLNSYVITLKIWIRFQRSAAHGKETAEKHLAKKNSFSRISFGVVANFGRLLNTKLLNFNKKPIPTNLLY